MSTVLVELIAKLFSLFSQKLLKRGGETWPGEIALKLDPRIGHKLQKYFDQIIYVIGTNGKTSTSKLLVQILRSNGKKVITNPSGANQLNGVISNILIQKNFKWKNVFQNNPHAVLIANASDPGICAFSEELKQTKKKYYGVPEDFLQKNTKVFGDYLYCPRCGTKLEYQGIYVSHIGTWFCPKNDFKPAKFFTYSEPELKKLSSLPSYLVINSEAVYLTTVELGLSPENTLQALESWEPAFGRGEKIVKDGKTYTFFLGKNPSSWTVVFESVAKNLDKDSILVLGLNNRVPDGHDVSWIWDVEVESKVTSQKSKVYIFGDRAYDMGERLKVEKSKSRGSESLEVEAIEPEVKEIIRKVKNSSERNILILANYSALLEIRKEITGKAIL